MRRFLQQMLTLCLALAVLGLPMAAVAEEVLMGWTLIEGVWYYVDEYGQLLDHDPYLFTLPPEESVVTQQESPASIPAPIGEIQEVEEMEEPVVEEPVVEEPVVEEPAEEQTPEEEPAVEEVPAEETPIEEVPAEEVPAEETPIEEIPAEEVPAEETPIEEIPAEEVPAEETPIEEIPAEEVPAEETPIEEVPAEEVPAEGTPIEEVPAEQPVEKPAIDEAPAEQPVVDEVPAEQPPVDQPVAEQAPVQQPEADEALEDQTDAPLSPEGQPAQIGEIQQAEELEAEEQPQESDKAAEMSVSIYVAYSGDQPYYGSTIQLLSLVAGAPEDAQLSYQWQYKDASGEWKDVPGATASTYEYVLDETNDDYAWRLVVTP